VRKRIRRYRVLGLFQQEDFMNRSFNVTLVACALAASGIVFAQGSINQSQSGNNNNQSISIGNSDGPAKKPAKSKKSVQKDDSGNVQSADVSGGGSGNINQSQTGNSNKQSISIGGNTSGKLPTVNQSQQGSGKEQSIAVDGKKVEKSQK
jgi:hypothetical protein